MFLVLAKCRNCGGSITAHGLDVLHRGSERPVGKVLLVERGKELAEGLGVVVLPIEPIPLGEPFLLVKGTCGWLKL